MAAPAWDLLLRRLHLCTLAPGSPLGELRDGALAVREGRIAWVGAERDLPAGAGAAAEWDGEGRWALPGLVDCHTHLVWAGQRWAEHEARLSGESYEGQARQGGGIRATVAATRAAGEEQLFRGARRRLDALLAEGVTTVEVKSGYGLDLETERRILRVARRLGRERPVRVEATFLGAHAVPPEHQGRPDAYLEEVCAMLPRLQAEGLVDAVDAFCDRVGFTPAQTERVFRAAGALGLPVKLHAEQLSDQGGAALAARHRALSADHLEHLSAEGAAALGGAGTVAVLLPGAFYCLREARRPPVELLRAHGVPMAVASDCNPGTSPMASLLLAMHLACTLLGLTPAEALAGVTREAARALGRGADRGTLEPGKRADLSLWEVERPAEIFLSLGLAPPHRRMLGGSFEDVPHP